MWLAILALCGILGAYRAHVLRLPFGHLIKTTVWWPHVLFVTVVFNLPDVLSLAVYVAIRCRRGQGDGAPAGNHVSR